MRAQSMQDITVRKRKVTGYTKRQNQTKTHLRHVIIFTAIVTTLLVILYLIGSHQLRYDNGAVWVHNKGSQTVKAVRQSEVNVKEVLSAIYPKKVVKKTVSKPHYNHNETMVERELKYKPIIAKYFPEETEIMLAIAKAESSLNSKAESYNCRYKLGGKTYDNLTKTYIDLETISKKRLPGYVSTFCRHGHEKFGWSKDSGLFGINSVHTTEELSIEEHVKLARKIYDSETKNAWVSYKYGLHKKYLTANN